MAVRIGILKGDGIGPAIVSSAKRVLEEVVESTSLEITFTEAVIGWDGYNEYGSTLPAETLETLESCDCCLVGPVMAGEYPDDDALGTLTPVGKLRTELDLYANVRPTRSYRGVSPEEIDLTIIRQNTEGFYADRNMKAGKGEFKPTEDLALSMRVVSQKESRRIAETAFEYADRQGVDSVTAVHKANVLKHGDGMFLEECRNVADEYPHIELADSYVDAFAMDIIRNPTGHSIAVTTNMFGDILSDEAAALGGSLGLAAGLNLSDTFAVAQAAHGAAPDIAGDGIANPTSMILSTKMMLDWVADAKDIDAARVTAEAIDDAVRGAIEDGSVRTPDIGGDATTDEFTQGVIQRVAI